MVIVVFSAAAEDAGASEELSAVGALLSEPEEPLHPNSGLNRSTDEQRIHKKRFNFFTLSEKFLLIFLRAGSLYRNFGYCIIKS